MNKADFKKYLDSLTYDKLYQDIEYIDFIGYSKCYKGWENLKDLVDWKDKKVADIGSFHGYYSFKVAEQGGIVTAMDRNDTILDTIRILNKCYNSNLQTDYYTGGDLLEGYDVVLCLNMLHHCKDIDKTLANIKVKTVIFEVKRENVESIEKYFKIIKQKDSHHGVGAEMRVILVTERLS